MKLVLFIIAALFPSIFASAKPLPPLGKRVYILDKASPERPAKIEGIEIDADEGSTVMKDPLPFNAKHLSKEPKADVVNVPAKSSQLKFEQVAVGGRFMVPGASFERTRLSVKKAEEPTRVEYKKKIRESEDLLKDFSW